MLTCKQFLRDLNEYLDDTLDPEMRADLQRHVEECPNCWVMYDTTQKTLKVFKGMEPKAIPPDIEARLMAALKRMKKDRGGICGEKVDV